MAFKHKMALSNVDKSFVKSQNVNRPLAWVAVEQLSSFSAAKVAKRQNDLMLQREYSGAFSRFRV